MNTLQSDKPHYAVLDFVRGFAAMWVFLAHSFLPAGIGWKIPILTDGRAAVDVFMILSGFLIFERYADCRSSLDWKKYFIARVFRICPLYYVLLPGVVAVWFGSQYWEYLPWLVGRLTFVFGFFPSMLDPAPLPDWSLTLEMQFYLVFPLLVILTKRLGWLPVLAVSSALTVFFYLKFSVYTINAPGPWGNFPQATLLPSKLPMFLLGGLIACASKETFLRFFAMHFLNLIGVVFPAMFLTGFKSGICMYLFTLSVVYLPRRLKIQSSPGFLKLLALASWKPFYFFGAISYGLYLFHPFVFHGLSEVMLKMPEMQTLGIWTRYVIFLSAALVVSIPSCYLLHVIIEKPGINLGKFLSRKLPA